MCSISKLLLLAENVENQTPSRRKQEEIKRRGLMETNKLQVAVINLNIPVDV